jgi:hypothetical protein
MYIYRFIVFSKRKTKALDPTGKINLVFIQAFGFLKRSSFLAGLRTFPRGLCPDLGQFNPSPTEGL